MKIFAGLNAWMLPMAALASFIFGGIWYGALAKHWMAAAGLTKDRIDAAGGQTPTMLVITYLCQLVMAWMLAGILLHMTKVSIPATTITGIISALFIWLGFVMTVLIVSHRYQLQPWSLTAIDGGHWLGVLLIQGALLGRFGLS